MTASPAQDVVGAVLNGRWRLVRLIGEGGMGAVYEADGPPGTGKRAIKLLHQEFVKEEIILARFFAESQATRTLNHPNVAQVLETGTAENGTPYLVMELLQGIPVSNYVDQAQALPTAQAVHIIHGVLQALAAAHGRGIVHRDIKPDNLFLVHDNNGSFHTKVLDFGIAKVMDVAGGMGQKTRTGVLLGTPGYMSPEQIKNSKGVDARADLWSVGIIFYELLTGISPFPADNEFARLTSVLTEEIQPVEQVMPHLAGWGAFFQRALAKDPARRFQTADEMASSLLATARGPSLRPPATLQAAPVPQPQPYRAPQPSGGLPYAATSVTPVGQGPQQTTAMPVMEHPSSIGPSPMSALPSSVMAPPGYSGLMQSPALSAPPGHSGLMQSPALSAPQGQSGVLLAPTATTPMQNQHASGVLLAPTATTPMQNQHASGVLLAPTATTPMQNQHASGLIPSPASMGLVPAVSQGSIPPPRPGGGATIASSPPSDLPSYVSGNAANVGPTHVSAQRPPGTPSSHDITPSIEIVDAPHHRGMVPYWVLGVVAFVAFGLGLALGLAVG